MLPAVLHNLSNIHDYATIVLKHHGGTLRFKGPWFTNTNFILTSDPMKMHRIMSKNFGNYEKGYDFHEVFEVFGGGIFNSDSHEWKQERGILHTLLKRTRFEVFLQQNIQKKLENCLLTFFDHASKVGAQVDLQDIVERFTFDTTCTILFGFDPDCLPYKFTIELSEIAFEKALPVLEDVIFYRHFIPRCLWKLQKWLQIGQEKKYKVAQENLDQFSDECIRYSKFEEQRRCKSTEEVDKYHFDLVKGLMKEGYGTGQMGDKYLKDTTLNLSAAGNSTNSAGLSWFFWLVSTHPIVEAKIIQEIKDNCLTQGENWITSCVDELNKLIYLHRHIPSYKFIPFNAGPRSCLGKDISLIEMNMVAIAILWKFHIQVVEGHPVTPRVSIILSMKHGLKVKVTKRGKI